MHKERTLLTPKQAKKVKYINYYGDRHTNLSDWIILVIASRQTLVQCIPNGASEIQFAFVYMCWALIWILWPILILKFIRSCTAAVLSMWKRSFEFCTKWCYSEIATIPGNISSTIMPVWHFK